jgi:hypothetical protein
MRVTQRVVSIGIDVAKERLMNSSSHSPVSHVLAMSFVLFASLILFASRAAAQDLGTVTITNGSRDTISIDKAKNDVIVLTLDRKAVLNGKYVYQGTIRSKKSGGFRVDGLVVSFLAPVVAQPQVR